MNKLGLKRLQEWLIVIFGCAQTSHVSINDWMKGQP